MLLRTCIGITSIFCISTMLMAMELGSPGNYAPCIAQYKALGHHLPHAPLLRHVSRMRLHKALDYNKDMSHKLTASALKALATWDPKVDTANAKLTLLLANRSRVPLSTTHADLLYEHSLLLQNMHQDIGEVEQDELALPTITSKEQTDLLIAYLSDAHISRKREDYTAYAYKKELVKYLHKCNLADICALVATITFLDIHDLYNTDVIVQAIAEIITDKLIKGTVSKEDQSQICTLPVDIQRKVVRKVLELTGLYAALHADHNSKRIIPSIELQGHQNWVKSVSWSPDSKYIASSSLDRTIRVWDTNTGTCIQSLKDHTSWVRAVAWSPDSKYIASGSDDTTIKVWDATTENCIHTLEGHTSIVWSAAWSPDRKYIASGSFEEIKIWDAVTGACINTLTGNTYGINSVSWSSDGKHIIGSSNNKIIKIWDAQSGICLHTLGSYINTITSIKALSPDGKYTAGSYTDNKIRVVWNAIPDIYISALKGHTGWVNSVSWSPDGKYIASSSDDKTVRLWQWIDPDFDKELINEISLENILAIAKSKKLLSYLPHAVK